MNKFLICLCLFSIACGTLCAQTLFSYGPYKVDKKEFLWAYRKNNASQQEDRQSVKAYLDLYIAYKLKVQAGRDAHLDSVSEFKKDCQAFNRELADQTMRKEEGIGRLSLEAMLRGQTDLELAQVYVGIMDPADTIAAYKRIREAQDQLKAGIPFESVAANYGTNPYLKSTRGYMGFITAFSLPYAAENLVFGLKDGEYSGIYRSRSGYHLFKRLSERPNPGVMRAAQILIAFAPKATRAEKDQVAQRANHVYDSLSKGAPFDSLVRRYSDDRITYYNYGALPDFTTGDYDPAFEAAAFALPSDGAFSKPVETAYGYHIIKRLGLQPAIKDSLDNQRWYTFQQKIFYSDRMDESKEAFAEAILPRLSYQTLHPDSAWLFRKTDTLIRTHGGEEYIRTIKPSPLFTLDGKVYTSTDWFRYLLYRKKGGPSDPFTPYPEQLRAYLHFAALEYFEDNLAKYNQEYRHQVQEFAEGNLLFAIMQQQIWGKSALDSSGPRNWFNGHPEQFRLRPSADLISFVGADSAQLSNFRRRLQANMNDWRTLLGAFQGINADSAHMELAAVNLDSVHAVAGTVTAPEQGVGNLWRCYALLKLYPAGPPRDYEEVRGLVLGDYQAHLEQEWLASLRKKYPVSVDKSVLASVAP